MLLFHKKKHDLPQEILTELKKIPRKKRKRAIELYKLYQEGKFIDLNKELSIKK